MPVTCRLRPSVLFLLAVAVLITHAGIVCADGEPPGRLYRVEVPLDSPAVQVAELRALAFEIDYYDDKTRAVYLYASTGGLAQLRELGYAPNVLEDVTPSESTIAALSDYTDEVEMDAWITQVATDHPAIARRFTYDTLTEEGREVPWLLVSDNVGTDEAEPRIFFVSQHHANEVMTPEVLADMMDVLTDEYGIDPEITDWVDRYQIYIIPSHNPDGVHYNFNVSSGWRKNRRDNGDGSFGVDLNRNYPYRWGPDGCNGSDGTPSSTTYRGPSAASEPETNGIMAVARDSHASISLTYHTSGQYVLMPFGCEPDLPDDPDRRVHRDVGSALGAAIVNDAGNGYYRMGTPPELLYSVDGGSDDWLHTAAGTVAFTIEMNTSQQPDYDTWRDDTVLRNREGWKYLLRRMSGSAIHGTVRDACTDDPLDAEVGLAGQVFSKGQEPRTTVPGLGFYHRVLIPGEYAWFADAAGYTRQEWPVVVRFGNEPLDVWLVPDGSSGLEARSLAVDDGGGDADGRLDPGEEADLLLTALASGGAVTGVTATLASTDPYLEILDGSVALPDLAAGGEAEATDVFRIRVLPDAPDGHVAVSTVTFAANETLCRNGGPVDLPVTRGVPACPFEEETLDQDPGWSVVGDADGWEYGPPQGTGGNGGPQAAFTGLDVYGTNLDGNYGSSEGEFVLTTTPFDLQGLRDAELRFMRWLNNEPGYDPARVEVSTDEVEWTEVWMGFGRDTGWEEVRLDLPETVDGADQVWVRFVLKQDGGNSRSGFFVDDVSFCGESVLTAGGKLKYESHAVIEDDPAYGNADGEVDAGETVTLEVSLRSSRNAVTRNVSAILTSDAPGVTVHNQVASYPDIDAGGVAGSLAPHFSFTAGPDCAERIPFTVEARYEDGQTTLSHFTLAVGTLQPGTLLLDDMETDLGWSVSGDATEGAWGLQEPFSNTYEDETTNPGEDHTSDPGALCWHTQSVPPPAVVDPFLAEVDGQTVLTSPVLSAAAYETLELRVWRWFYRGGGGGPDTFRIEVSADGQTFQLVSEMSVSANAWTEAVHELSESVALTDGLQVRFVATDGGDESIVEAGVDDLELSGSYWACDAWDPPVLQAPNPVGDTLRASRAGADVRLDWQEPPVDSGHDRATFYSVRRSDRADSGFAEVARPTGTLHVDAGAAGSSANELFFYLVTAENSGGSE